MKMLLPLEPNTSLLDNLCRRLQDIARSLLDAAGLPEEYFEFALTMAATIINYLPTARHPLRHSPMRRWTGKVQAVKTSVEEKISRCLALGKPAPRWEEGAAAASVWLAGLPAPARTRARPVVDSWWCSACLPMLPASRP